MSTAIFAMNKRGRKKIPLLVKTFSEIETRRSLRLSTFTYSAAAQLALKSGKCAVGRLIVLLRCFLLPRRFRFGFETGKPRLLPSHVGYKTRKKSPLSATLREMCPRSGLWAAAPDATIDRKRKNHNDTKSTTQSKKEAQYFVVSVVPPWFLTL
jgi:hypothetical protein